MVLELKHGLTEQLTKVHMLMEKKKEKGLLCGVTVQFTLANLKIITLKGKGNMFGKINGNIQVLGSITKWKEKENLSGQTEENMMVK